MFFALHLKYAKIRLQAIGRCCAASPSLLYTLTAFTNRVAVTGEGLTIDGRTLFFTNQLYLVTTIDQSLVTKLQRRERGEANCSTDNNHNSNLVHDGSHWQCAGKNLTGHHAWQGNDAHANHTVQSRQ